MKIGFKQIEKLRRNPKSINDKNLFFGGRSKFQRWQDAVGRYHAKGDNLSEAEKYLESSFSRLADNALNKRDLIKYTEHLVAYEHDYKSLNVEPVGYRMGFSLDTTLDHIISGQLSRIDVNTSTAGYNAYSFEKELTDWESELRFPLIQKVVSDYFSCPIEEVAVGIYHLNNGKHFNNIFTANEIHDAVEELSNILKEVNKYIKK